MQCEMTRVLTIINPGYSIRNSLRSALRKKKCILFLSFDTSRKRMVVEEKKLLKIKVGTMASVLRWYGGHPSK